MGGLAPDLPEPPLETSKTHRALKDVHTEQFYAELRRKEERLKRVDPMLVGIIIFGCPFLLFGLYWIVTKLVELLK